jgi:WD40 repeat protein
VGQLTGHGEGAKAVCFGPDGGRLVSGCADGTVRLWDVAAAKERCGCRGHGRAVLCVAFSPDGRFVASGGADRAVRLWDAASGQEVKTMETPPVAGVPVAAQPEGPSALAFSPDGRRLAVADASGGKLYDVATGLETLTLQPPRGGLAGIAFRPDGQAVVGNRAVGPTSGGGLWVWHGPHDAD